MTEQHVPVERLAAYAAGDLDATAALEVEAHVLLCADCRADAEAVTRATAALSSLGPVAMPADVAARVDAAIGEADRAAGPVGDLLPMPAKRKRPSFAGLAAVAAGVALLAAISVPLVSGDGTTGGGAARTTADGAAPEGAATETRRLESGLNYKHDTLQPLLARALAAPGRDQSLTGGTGAGAAEDAGSSAPAAPRANATASPGAPAVASGEVLAATAQLATDPGRLAACVAALGVAQRTEAGKVPLLVDFARYEGKDAVIVVFPTETKGEVRADRVDVWVVGPRCGITAGDDDVLDFARFPRPEGL